MTGMEELLPGLHKLPLFNAAECDSIVARVKAVRNWESAEVRTWDPTGYSSEVDSQTRNARLLPDRYGEDIYNDFETRINRKVKPLVKHVWRVGLNEHSGTQMVRYLAGGHYIAHRDAGLDLSDRYFTVLCYLNDDFEGGATSFPSLHYRVLPERGKAIVFPSTYSHRAETVVSGEKYVLVSWILGPTPMRWI